MARLGVTGHRKLIDPNWVSVQINSVLDWITMVRPGPITLYTSLAEGADRLAARQTMLRHNSCLIVPLPLPKSEYLKDFSGERSREEFLELLSQAEEVMETPPQATRKKAYRTAGEYILAHCELLIAIWDGKEAQGEGGTGQIVAEARRRGLPMAHIVAGNGCGGVEDDTLPGNIKYENIPITWKIPVEES